METKPSGVTRIGKFTEGYSRDRWISSWENGDGVMERTWRRCRIEVRMNPLAPWHHVQTRDVYVTVESWRWNAVAES